MTGREIANTLYPDVGRQQAETACDELLCAALGLLGRAAAAREQPDDDATRQHFDEGVGAEADERDRTGADSGAECNRELDDVPGIAAVRQHASPPFELVALTA